MQTWSKKIFHNHWTMKIVFQQYNNYLNNNLFNNCNNLFNNNLFRNRLNIILFNRNKLFRRRMQLISLFNRLIRRKISLQFSFYIIQIIKSRINYLHLIKLFKITILNKIMIIVRNLLHWLKCILTKRNTMKVSLKVSAISLQYL